MKFLLDTNICIYLIRKEPVAILQKFNAYTVGEIGISSITVAELQFGIQKSRYVSQNHRALEQFLVPLIIADFDHCAAAAYGSIRAQLEAQGQPIGPLDTLIAAHALSLNVTLVTHNTREFSRIPALDVIDWTTD